VSHDFFDEYGDVLEELDEVSIKQLLLLDDVRLDRIEHINFGGWFLSLLWLLISKFQFLRLILLIVGPGTFAV